MISAPAVRPTHRIALAPLVALVVFVLALAVRLPDLDRFATIDESRWIQRGADFWTAVQNGQHDETFLIGHPGVTTMWLVGLGMGPDSVERMATRSGAPDVTRREGYLDSLVAARRAFVLLGAGCMAVVSLLVWRLAGPVPGGLTGLLLAADPFFSAHGQVAHLDATLAGFVAIAALSAMIAGLAGGGLLYLALAGVATGLALLTKAPSIYLLPAIPLLALVPLVRDRQIRRAVLGRRLSGLVIWGALALVVVFLLWPAFRADTVGTLQKLAAFTARVGGGEHDNFFLGQPSDDPGLLYYPVMLVFRMGLGTFAGLVLLAALMRRAEWRGVIVATGLFMLGFWLMMNLGPKKFDRYLLPLFPLLTVWAAFGWWTLADRRKWSLLAKGAVLAGAVTLQLVPALLVRPYYLAYFNPLLGGGPIAQQQVLVGWGEGLAPVAAYLNEKPLVIGAPTVASSYHRVLQAHLDGSALPIDRVSFADYVVPYVNTLQRGLETDVLGPIVRDQAAEFSVWHNGIEYARVYRGPRFPIVKPLGAEVGNLTLVEALVAPGVLRVQPQETVDVLLRWKGTTPGQDAIQLRLDGEDSRTLVADSRRVGEDGVGGNRGGAPDQMADLHTLTIPRNAAPGPYRLLAVRGTSEVGIAEIAIEAASGR